MSKAVAAMVSWLYIRRITGVFCLSLLMHCVSLAPGFAADPPSPSIPQPSPSVPTAEPVTATTLPTVEVLRQGITAMKDSPKGPFKRIRWFCKDGSVLPPKPYACVDVGGGVQHGEWNEQIRLLRSQGYLVGNVLAALDPESFRTEADWLPALKQIVLERFLVDADDGWIFRQARFYPGALQAENENDYGRALLLDLFNDPAMLGENFLVLREAVRLIPHGRWGTPMIEMRQQARAIEEKDPDFNRFRVKLHNHPDAGDAGNIRAYASGDGNPELSGAYRKLADLIDEVFMTRDVAGALQRLAAREQDAGVADRFRLAAERLASPQEPFSRFADIASLLADIRVQLPRAGSPTRMLALLDLSVDLEHEAFRLASRRLDELPKTDRRTRLAWLQNGCRVVYGLGLISRRQRLALENSFARIAATPLTVDSYKAELDYLARIAAWSEDSMHFHFRLTVDHLTDLDPLFARYIPDRLRGCPLAEVVRGLDSLQRDAGRLTGIRHRLFDARLGSGLRVLNSGLARGTMRVYRPGEEWKHEAIYLLPETLDELPPLAGILTEGEGNSLSHVQLLARNLGIPNVAIDSSLAGILATREGQPVVLAASTAGVVELADDGPEWNAIFRDEQQSGSRQEASLVQPDADKLDLDVRRFVMLQELRSADSGRIAGPKAANLGELKHHYPELVTEGLVIPFGLFREYLEQPIEPDGPTIFQWLRLSYEVLGNIEDARGRQMATADVLRRLRDRIRSGDPGPEFRSGLRQAMARGFGAEGSYGVFVRSDTNVEDLPGFSGAGLNLTVPHVVGFDNIIQAVLQVWASPFTERAYGWRQAHMAEPEQVYASVLLMRSVAADKSGVMVTADVTNGDRDWLTVAVNEGVGGAVAGQRAEELLIDRRSGMVRLQAQAAEPLQRILLPEGGVAKVPASGRDEILTAREIESLLWMAGSLPERFPRLVNAAGETAPADIEFGFVDGQFALFQIRPFLESSRARQSGYLQQLDSELAATGGLTVDLNEVPREEP